MELLKLRDHGNRSPLHAAVIHGHYGTARFLLNHGDPKVLLAMRDGWGWTVLHWVAYQEQVEFARFLLMKGADPRAKGSRGRTPHMVAMRSGNRALRRLFESTGKAPQHR